MKKKIMILSMIVTLIFTTAVYGETFYDNETSVTNISKVSDDEKYSLLICDLYGSWIPQYSRSYIEDKIGSKPYWRMGKNEKSYGIYKTDKTHYLIFTEDNNTYGDRWYVSKIPSKELFDKYVKIGTKETVVRLLDPDMTDLINGGFEDYKLTKHRFKDGTFKSVHYKKNKNGEYIVSKIDQGTDGLAVVDNLLDIDYDLIKNENPNEEAEFIQKLKKLNDKENKPEPVKTKVKTPSKVKIKSANRTGKKKITVRFYKTKNAKKYQIQYAYNRKFKKAKTKVTVKNKFVLKIKAKKTCYIRVRGINQNKKGKWSKVKKVKKK